MSAYVGVIKDKTCKDDMELKIYYDCDDKGSKTGPKDFTGSFSGNHNMNVSFCLVDATKFKRLKKDYAVLKLGELTRYNVRKMPDDYYRARILIRHMDAEDKHEEGYVILSSGKDSRGNTVFYDMTYTQAQTGPVRMSKRRDLDLAFICYEADENSNESLPELGYSYGVFGKLYDTNVVGRNKVMGSYTSDDEKNGNANKAYVNDILCWSDYDTPDLKLQYTPENGYVDLSTNKKYMTGNTFMNFIEFGDKITRFYISKSCKGDSY